MKRRRYDPLAPLTPRQLRRMAIRYTRAQISPVLSQINKEYAARAAAGRSAIESSTNALAGQLAGEQGITHNLYAQAQGAQSGIDNAMAARLAAAGISAQHDVGGQLASAGIGPGENLAQTGAGARAASFGIGSAALSRLVAEGAARENYAARLPGIARLGGASTLRDLALQIESGRQKDVGELRSKIPGITSQIEQDLASREFQKAAARLSYGGDLLSYKARSAATAESARGHNLTYASRMAAIAAANARTGMTLKERARHNQISEREQAKRDAASARDRRQRLKQQRRAQWWREHQKKKSSGGGGKGIGHPDG